MQFQAYSPDAEVLGVLIARLQDIVGSAATPIWQRRDLHPVSTHHWYPMQPLLDVLGDIRLARGLRTLVEIGMNLPDLTTYPADIESVEAAVRHWGRLYASQHRHDTLSAWILEDASTEQVICRSSTPYPSDLEYGVIYTLARRYRPHPQPFTVTHQPGTVSRRWGADTCTYRVTWATGPPELAD